MVTDSGHFMIDAVSGGIAAILELVWHIFMYYTKEKSQFVVLLDEVENHLHPAMQREILPKLSKAFPQVQFIVSTHSPFIVGSVKESNVYALRYGNDSKVYSQQLDIQKNVRTATEVLQEVLGVPVTMPIWAEIRLKEIISRYSRLEHNDDNFMLMRNDLIEAGLESFAPEAFSKVIEE